MTGFFEQGRAAHRAGQLGEAMRLYHAALALDPGHAGVMGLLGTLLAQKGDAAGAEAWLTKAADLTPQDPGVQFNLALMLAGQARNAEALERCARALAAFAGHERALLLQANLLFETGAFGAAVVAYDRLIAQRPGDANLYYQRGRALGFLRRHQDALADFDRALAIRPERQVIVARGAMLQYLRRYPESIAAFRQALALEPQDGNLQMALGQALLTAGDNLGAVAALDAAYALDPKLPSLPGNRHYAKRLIADWRDFAGDGDAILAGVARGEEAASNLITMASDPAQQQACARIFAAKAIPIMPPLWTAPRSDHARLRLGYVSKDLREHATMVLAGAMFAGHDPEKFETFAFSTAAESGTKGRAQAETAFEHFHHGENLSDRDLAALIHKQEIDILVDLDGYTINARLGYLGYRPAPLTVSFLGYPGTLGSPVMDYIIADRIVLPENEQRFYDEQVVYMPVTYQPNTRREVADAVPSREQAGLPEQGFVFCCFNAAHKFTPTIFDVWMRLLRDVPGSVLWLLGSVPALEANLRREADAWGVDPARLVFAPRTPLPQYLARLALADLFLDTLPYNAHTTASDALWCGLPVLTCLGNSFPGRVAASLNHASGLDEMTVATLEDYEALALALARDPARLAALKTKLQANRDSSVLFDAPAFTRAIEAAYQAMWDRHRQGRPPVPISL